MTTTILNHPVLKTKISLLRDIKTSNQNFRLLTNQIASLIAVVQLIFSCAYNSSWIGLCYSKPGISIKHIAHTKLSSFSFSSRSTCPKNRTFSNSKIWYQFEVQYSESLLKGLGMTDPFLDLIPDAIVHHLGLYREKSTFCPVEYYNKLPRKCVLDVGFVLDPMVNYVYIISFFQFKLYRLIYTLQPSLLCRLRRLEQRLLLSIF